MDVPQLKFNRKAHSVDLKQPCYNSFCFCCELRCLILIDLKDTLFEMHHEWVIKHDLFCRMTVAYKNLLSTLHAVALRFL